MLLYILAISCNKSKVWKYGLFNTIIRETQDTSHTKTPKVSRSLTVKPLLCGVKDKLKSVQYACFFHYSHHPFSPVKAHLTLYTNGRHWGLHVVLFLCKTFIFLLCCVLKSANPQLISENLKLTSWCWDVSWDQVWGLELIGVLRESEHFLSLRHVALMYDSVQIHLYTKQHHSIGHAIPNLFHPLLHIHSTMDKKNRSKIVFSSPNTTSQASICLSLLLRLWDDTTWFVSPRKHANMSLLILIQLTRSLFVLIFLMKHV